MKLTTTVALASALTLASPTLVTAANAAEPGGTSSMSEMMRGGTAGTMLSVPRERPLLSLALQHRADLALSAKQEGTLRGLVDRFGGEAHRRARDIDAAERELVALLEQEPADLARLEDKVRAIEKLRADLRLRRIQTIAEGRAALTPGQRAKLDQLAAARGGPGRGAAARGAEEMQRFMNSERMPQAMSAMMAMAERMGGGDTMLGMVRMMEMMSMMGGGMMGGEGMKDNPPHSQPRSEDGK